jgi:hypothetical protein
MPFSYVWEVFIMIDFSRYKIVLFSAIFSICVFLITGFFSLKAYNSAKNTEKQFAASVKTLKQEMVQLGTRIKEFEKLLKETEASPTASNLKGALKAGIHVNLKNKKQKTVNAVPAPTKQNQLDVIADLDPNIIQELHDERVMKNEIESELDYLRGISGEQRQFDKNKYDEEINDLYRKTLPRRFGGNLSEEERQQALDELLDKYPDSYAAAKAVSSKALESVMRNNLEAAEGYYDMLLDVQGKKTDRVVLDNGFEAVPTVEHTMAYAYFRSGRTEDVKAMVKSLEENYSDSLFRVRSRGGPRIVSGEEAIDRIYRITGIGNTSEGNP